MGMRPNPVVRLIRNPWRRSLNDGTVLQVLTTAAIEVDEQLVQMIDAGQVKDGSDSLATVILDPTRPRWATKPRDLVVAIVELGPNARGFLPNAGAKADAHERHGLCNGVLVTGNNLCLGDDDFAYGNSADYKRVVGGGSGLSVEQDGELTLKLLQLTVDPLLARRSAWLAERRRAGSQRWYNEQNQPGIEYLDLLNLIGVTPVA